MSELRQGSDGGGASPPERDVDAAVLRCLSRIEADGDAAIDAECARHPELEGVLRRRVRLLREAGLIASAGASTGGFPERLGDFRLIQRLGGGGMGVVYLAEQTSLSRRVALKLIRPEHLYFPGTRARFAREAQAIARLAHPGIVPVHAIGEECGIPYLAMELIDGASLAAVVARLASRDPSRLRGGDLCDAIGALAGAAPDPSDRASMPFSGSWFDACAWIARELAQALEHAHQRGVIHRDVKPSNVMLTASGRVMLVDFGLASTEGTDGLTRTGSALGSLPYMAPEQIEGRAAEIGPRTDVYGLGVTLYECLALKRPFEGEDRTVLRARILDARVPRLRALAGGIPRDLEAIVAVAMAPEPGRRYRSAADLARDLTHFLEREPVEARRAGALARMRRWAQRNPARATAAALAVLVIVGAPAGFGVTQRRIAAKERTFNAELGLANAELEAALGRESEERERAQTNFERALEAVDTMLTKVGNETLAYVPQMEAVRHELLEDALGFYDGFVVERGDDPSVRLRRAITQRKVGYIRRELGRLEAAREATSDSVRELRALEAVGVDDSELRRALCASLAEHAAVLLALQQFEQAEAIQRELIVRLEAAIDAGAEGRDDARRQLAVTEQHLAFLLRDTGRGQEAIAHAERAVTLLRGLVEQDGASPDLQHRVGTALLSLASMSSAAVPVAQSERRYLDAVDALRAALARSPEHPAMRESLASALGGLGRLLSPAEIEARHRPAGPSAEEALREAIAINTELIGEYPLRTLHRANIAGECTNLCIHLARTGRLGEARPYGEQAVAEYEALVRIEPQVADHRSHLGAALSNVAMLDLNLGAPARALDLLDRAIVEHRLAIAAEPKNPEFTGHLRQYAFARSTALLELGRWRETLDLLDEFEAAHRDAPARVWAVERRVACAAAAERDESIEASERASSAAAVHDGAIERLRGLVESGYSRQALASNAALAALRERADFRALVE